MIALERVVRFAVLPPHQLEAALAHATNGYAGRPAQTGLDRHYEVHVRCVGTLDPVVNYLIDIKDIDRAIRAILIPALCDAAFPTPGTHPASIPSILQTTFPRLQQALGGILDHVRLHLSPYHSMSMTASSSHDVLLRQRFDFAASHRLHVPALSEAENIRRFGKCNNPRGHGHNYQFEPCLRLRIAADGSTPFTLARLEAITETVLLDRFDHKHLNEDTTEFSNSGGVIPTVENIARVFHDLLAAALMAEGAQATLDHITVWETDRTSATFPATPQRN